MDKKFKNSVLEKLRRNAAGVFCIFVFALISLLYFMSTPGTKFLIESNENVQTARLYWVSVLGVLLIMYIALHFTRKILRKRWQNEA
jgi:hypothetical protein